MNRSLTTFAAALALAVSLGTPYHRVPGFSVGFGSDRKAKEYLEKAVAINPDGIDRNYFYGEFLYDEGRRRDLNALLMKLPAR